MTIIITIAIGQKGLIVEFDLFATKTMKIAKQNGAPHTYFWSPSFGCSIARPLACILGLGQCHISIYQTWYVFVPMMSAPPATIKSLWVWTTASGLDWRALQDHRGSDIRAPSSSSTVVKWVANPPSKMYTRLLSKRAWLKANHQNQKRYLFSNASIHSPARAVTLDRWVVFVDGTCHSASHHLRSTSGSSSFRSRWKNSKIP